MSDNNCAEVQLFDLISKILDSQGYHIFVTMARSAPPLDSFEDTISEDNKYEYEYVVLVMPKLDEKCIIHNFVGNNVSSQFYHGFESIPMYYIYKNEQNMLTKYCIDHGLPTRILYDRSARVPRYIDYLYSAETGLMELHEFCDLPLAYEDFEKYSGFPHDEFCKIIISRIILLGFVFKKPHQPTIINIESGKYTNAEEILIDMHISNNVLDIV